jgi:hypothetical protein
MEPSRDYTDGEATSLWRKALASGAIAVPDDAAALATLEEMMGS